jgi:branched-chain amino acid transport system substrate-binding protein
MKNLRSTRRLLGAIALVSAATVALAGCGRGDGGASEASPGITEDSVTIGINTPLTGATAGPGNCTADGAIAYFGVKNAEGGIEFGDGVTRTVEIETYDDTYDPQKSLANFQQMVADEVFIAGLGLGTPTNRAWREAAIAEGVPQVLVMTGDPLFSDREESPMQLGLVPIYQQEGGAFGELLAASGEEHKVAMLYQNDDYGKGYAEGFKDAVEGADNIEIVGELTYEASDTSLDAQVTELAATGADVFFNAVSVTPLVIAELQKAQAIGWLPSWFLPSNTSSPVAILQPGGADVYPGVYTASFSGSAASPVFQESEEGQAFLAAIDEYTNQEGVPGFPHCVWSWIGASILEEAFTTMTEPTRESFLEALYGISGFQAPFLLEGTTIDTTTDGRPAVSGVVIQKYNGAGFAPAPQFG